MKPIPFLVPASVDVTDDALLALRQSVEAKSGLSLVPVRVPSGALLPLALENAREVLAWAPAGIASALGRLDLATPMLSARRRDGRTRSAVLVARRDIEGLAGLAGKRVGWVSRLSAAGYDVPKLYLESFGVEVHRLFAEERFCGTHDAAVAALVDGEVDVIATHTGKLRSVFASMPMRALATIGPIPADLIVAGVSLPAAVRPHLAQALLSASVGPYTFVATREGYLGLFDLLQRRLREAGEANASALQS